MMLWQCPGHREVLDEIFEKLKKGLEHIIIYLPCWRMDEFWNSVRSVNELYRYPFAFPISLPLDSPYDYLARCAVDPSKFDKTKLMEQPMNKENICLLIPADSPHSLEQEWIDFIEELNAQTSDYLNRQRIISGSADSSISLPWRLLIILPTYFNSPKNDTNLETYLWSGITRKSDLFYAIERCTEEYNVINTSSRLWLDSICQGLGMRDASLCPYFFKDPPLDEEEVLKKLKDYPFLKMDADLINSVRAVDDGSYQERDFRKEMKELQDYGIFDLDCRNVKGLHPAALAQADCKKAITRLLWQGQIRTYLPLVQEVISFIQTRLNLCYGDDWDKKDPNYSGFEMDIGPLTKYINIYFKKDCDYELLNLAACWCFVRNELAHGRLICLEKAIEAVEIYEKLRKIHGSCL